MKYTEEKMKAMYDKIGALRAHLKAESLAIAKERHRRMSHLEIEVEDLEYEYACAAMGEHNIQLRFNDENY